jgi:hypothetical protein
MPLVHLQFFGRCGFFHSDCGWCTSHRLYGWPVAYGTRSISEPWDSRTGLKTVRPLENRNTSAVLLDLAVAAALIAGTIHAVQTGAFALWKRQCSLRSLLLLPVFLAAICSFIRYDRSIDLVHFLSGFHESAKIDPSFQTSQAITDAPPYLFVPILFGIGAAVCAGLSAVTRFVAFLLRAACRSHIGPPTRCAGYRTIAVVALLCLAAGAVHLGVALRQAVVRSRTAVLGKMVTEWVGLYIVVHDGKWPQSWEAIRECAAGGDGDSESVIEAAQRYVVIDFRADPRVVATQSTRDFGAIRPVESYGIEHQEYWGVPFLIETLQGLTGPAVTSPQQQSGSFDRTSSRSSDFSPVTASPSPAPGLGRDEEG